ncbi:MAG: SRPBCC family protein [Acidimicrobiales bacterium]
MRSISVSRSIPASEQAVWDVLADFPNIADWNTGVKTSYATGDAAEGVGATRHCDLSPTGVLEETIRVWEPTERLVISIDSTKRLPIKRGEVTFELDGDTNTTSIELRYDYETRFGPIGKLMGPMIDKQLTGGFDGFLADLDTAATV